MKCIRLFIVAALLGASGAAMAQDSAPAADAAIDPRAMDALDRMGKALRALQQFEVHADSTSELVLESGEKVEFGGTVDYKVKAPHGLYARLHSDRRERELYYDGKSLTIYAPKSKFYATLPAPGTLGALVEKAQSDYGLEMPLADLFVWGTEKAPVSEIQRATFVGPAFIGETPVAHYAYRQGDSDWQVWLDGDALPRKLVIVDNDSAERPEYTAVLDWNKAASPPADAFAFKPGADAYEISFYPAVAEEGGK